MPVSDLSIYIQSRKKADSKFAKGFDDGYADFKIGVAIKALRKGTKLAKEELATLLQ